MLGEIAQGGLGARQDEQVLARHEPWIREPGELHVRFAEQGRQILGVGDPGAQQRAHVELPGLGPLVHGDADGAVLLVQAVLQVGQHRQHRGSADLFQQGDALLEEAQVAHEAVHHEAEHPGAVRGGQQVQRALGLGEHAPLVDVHDKDDRRARVGGGRRFT